MKILAIKNALRKLGPMHPGSLSQQRRARGAEYHQLSFSYAGRGHTFYVRPEDVDAVRREIKNFRRFRKLTGKWIELEIARAGFGCDGSTPRRPAPKKKSSSPKEQKVNRLRSHRRINN